jgi:hypothetical protein
MGEGRVLNVQAGGARRTFSRCIAFVKKAKHLYVTFVLQWRGYINEVWWKPATYQPLVIPNTL